MVSFKTAEEFLTNGRNFLVKPKSQMILAMLKVKNYFS